MDQQSSETSPPTPHAAPKTNPWMVTTLILAGIIIGYGVSQIPALKTASTQTNVAVVQPNPNKNQLSDEDRGPVLTSDQISKLPDDDAVMGDPNAPITLIEFSDFQCPFCARFFQETLPSIEENYIKTGKVKLIYRDFPLQDKHPQALLASLTAECAHEQGKFEEMHDVIFAGQADWAGNPKALDLMNSYAKQIALNTKQFSECVTSKKYGAEVQKDLVDAVGIGVKGTPAFFINGKPLLLGAVPYESFFKVIFDAELAGKKWEVQRDEVRGYAVKVE